jgi:hypothetical protein
VTTREWNWDTAKRAAWTAVQAFLGAFVVLAPGIWTAPNLQGAKAAAIAALSAAVAAAFSVIKNTLVPPQSTLR